MFGPAEDCDAGQSKMGALGLGEIVFGNGMQVGRRLRNAGTRAVSSCSSAATFGEL